jgi:hypothetical protein
LASKKLSAAQLKTTTFYLLYTQPALREVKHIKCYQDYYPKLTRNVWVGVLNDQTLTTRMDVPGIEPTYASGKEANVLTHSI